MKRTAIIENARGWVSLETVRAYLPANYSAEQADCGDILITGEDSCGWTLDGYVIPRLASGLIFAREVI